MNTQQAAFFHLLVNDDKLWGKENEGRGLIEQETKHVKILHLRGNLWHINLLNWLQSSFTCGTKKINYAGSDKCGSTASDAEKLAKPIMRSTCACICVRGCAHACVCVRVCACVRPCFGMPMYCHILFSLLLLCGVQRHLEGLYLFGSGSSWHLRVSVCLVQ